MSPRRQGVLIALSVVVLGAGVLALRTPQARQEVTTQAGQEVTPHARQEVRPQAGQEALAAHNQLRCSVDPPAQVMPALTWDPLLEQLAQEWADSCPTSHNDNRTARYQALGGSGYVGENMAWGFSTIGSAVLTGWGAERAAYNYLANTCSGVCGHYTQVVWASTLRVGCAQASCPNVYGALYVCNYASGGNVTGQQPYMAGTGPNEACQEDTPANVASEP